MKLLSDTETRKLETTITSLVGYNGQYDNIVRDAAYSYFRERFQNLSIAFYLELIGFDENTRV